jgi:NAD(P)-dependent dehydrogenase (short-subunit alcohol dehydrogenase family)
MIDQMTTAEWLWQNDVNSTAWFYGPAAVPEMRRYRCRGSIVNLSSVAP